MKKIRIIVVFIIFLIITLLNSVVKAELMNPSRFFGIQEIDEGSSMGYSIGNPKANGDTETGGPSAKIWNIIQYDNINGTNPKKTNLYCVRAGAGFTSSTQQGLKIEEYNLKFDMYSERDEIASQDKSTSNKILYKLVTGEHYNELLALANIIYIPDVSTDTEKEQLLELSGATAILEELGNIEGKEQYPLTDDEIEAVQQSAIWYFTNYDEMYDGERKYDKTDETDWLWYTTDSSQYKNLADYNPTGAVYAQTYAGSVKQDQAEELYKYLIETAKAEADKYADPNGKYKNKLTLYATINNRDAQPLMEIERNPQEFDLALRKSIVSVTNSEGTAKGITNIEGENAERQLNADGTVKNINQTTIQGATTTAEYYNRKDPVVVSTGDYITYSISIYNEGEKEGRATKIIDQLPEGLEFTEVVSGDFEVLTGGYDQTNNTLTLTRKSGNTTNLPAYNGKTLESEVIQIKCKVTGTAGANNKILTNIAWIAEEVDGVTGETITTEVGKDRDSEPSTIETQTKDELVTEDEGYRGNESNDGKDITDNNSYFAGQQDDDDFEKIIIPKAEGNYKLQLEKVDEEGNLITTSNAEFSWRLPGEEQDRTGTTANGILDLGTVEITQTGTDSITITETNPPAGYNKLIGSITVEITKELSNGIYTVTDAKIVPENTNASIRIENGVIKITVKNEKQEFDLALRKSIVSVINSEGAGKEVTNIEGENAERQLNADGTVKNINQTTIQGATTTAEYYNRKDPVVVSTGDYITYSISIYNEGEKEGRATKIIDQLPEGLEFTEVVSGDFEVLTGGYDQTNNTLTLTRKSGNTTNLPAYNGKTLESEVIQIKCKVTGTAGANNKILTNIAWIAEEVDGVTGETITTEVGKDRDSEPSTIETQTKDELVTEDEGYRGNESNDGKDITDNNSYFAGQQDDDDFEKIIIPKAEGNYKLQLEKVDEEGNLITTSNAEFSWRLPGEEQDRTGTTTNGLLDLGTVEITQTGTDSITITETNPPAGYSKLIGNITVEITKGLSNGAYTVTDAKIVPENTNASVRIENGVIKITVKNQKLKFDLALRKFITNVDDTPYSREPQPDTSTIGTQGTAEYNHTKQPIMVKRNSEITYTIRVYNEGGIDGYVQEVTDYIPEGLEFLPENTINQQYEWVMYDSEGNITQNAEETVEIKTDYLSKEKETEQRQNLIKAYNGTTLDYKEVQVVCKVKEDVESNVKLTNLAEITEDYNDYNEPDKDSTPDNVQIPEDLPGYKDDEIICTRTRR